MASASLLLAFIDGLGGGEMLLIFFVILLLFGGQRLPELARGLGKSIREFKKATSGVENEIKRALEEPPPSRRRPEKPRLIEPIAPSDEVESDDTPPPPQKPAA
jgi:sec-independent protein translocase protein TatA